MHNMIITLKDSTTNYLLGFNDYDSARATRDKIRERLKDTKAEHITIKDDFGMEAQLPMNIESISIEDAGLAYKGKIERDIAQKREQAAFHKRREGDMELMRLYPQGNQMMPAAGGYNA